MATWPDKDPNEKLDYTIDWSAALVATDTITASEWTIPEGITATAQTFDNTKAIVWLSGGAEGVKYAVANRVTTAGGRIMERTVTIKIKSR